MIRQFILTTLLLSTSLFARAQNGQESVVQVDSTRANVASVQTSQGPKITYKSFILPTALVTYGALSIHSPALQDVNEEIHRLTSAGPNVYTRPYVEDYLMFVPAVAAFGMSFCGLKGSHPTGEAAIIYGISNLISSGISYGVKNLGVETRPDGTDDKSFPSGHTTTAFVAAEFLRLEYSGKVHWSVIAGGYLVAGSVGYFRLYHNRHWFGDVVAGAGIGMAGTRFTYFLYPHLKRWISGGKKEGGNVMLLPTYSPGGAWGFAMAARL